VAALIEPPFDSTILEISLAEILSVPLKIMCSKKWETPEVGPASLTPPQRTQIWSETTGEAWSSTITV
jgi:hypothetical protein